MSTFKPKNELVIINGVATLQPLERDRRGPDDRTGAWHGIKGGCRPEELNWVDGRENVDFSASFPAFEGFDD